jgi:hypothetical protein
MRTIKQNLKSRLSGVILTSLLISLTASSQGIRTNSSPTDRKPHEVPGDGFTPANRHARQTSPAYRHAAGGFFAVQVNVDSSGMNIVGDAANEPSIAIDLNDPLHIAIGWRQFDTITSDFRQAGYGYSQDGGLTWTFPGVLDQGVFHSDPVLDADDEGNFFYYSLEISPDYFCTLYKSTDGGASWDGGIYAYGGDKAWMCIDPTTGIGHNQLYYAWDFAGCCFDDWFTRSTDAGQSFDAPIPIPEEPIWGVDAVGVDGAVYVAGRRSTTNTEFVVAKSSTAQDSAMGLAFDFAVQVEMGGNHLFAIGYGPNPGGLMGQVWIAADHSSAPSRGNLYMLCSVDPAGTDPLDVHFVRSTDGGATWSSPIRVNDDSSNTAWQWFGTMSVAPTGRIDVVWLDTRDDAGFNSSLYYSYSTDAGLTWSQNERLSEAFDPTVGWPQQNKLGDYFDMVSDETGAHLAWAGTFNAEQDVYYGRITSPVSVDLPHTETPRSFALLQNYPNPFNPRTIIRYQITDYGWVKLGVFDVLGREVARLVDEVKTPGTYEVTWEASGQASGVCFYRLSVGTFVETKKLVLVR